jgi:uncharacterized membrane protein (DUF4010 family)
VNGDRYWQALSVGTAVACGLLIGIERGFKLRGIKQGARVAGVRTFTLLGIVSGIAGLVGSAGQPLAGGALILGAAAVLAVGYANQPGLETRPDATTPVAGMATLGLGFLAGSGNPGLAIAGASVAIVVLALRTELHGLIDRLDEDDVKALARYAVIAGAVLPFLPNSHYGPLGAWNPQKLWLVVVLVTGFSFLGYVANRIFGERNGTIATALIGGAYSSTAVTQSLAQRLGSEERGGAESAGIALATSVMYLRVIFLVGILATRVVVPFTMLILPAFLASAAAGWWLYREAPASDAPAPPGNPIAILPALGFLAFVAVAAVAARWAQGHFGESGLAGLLLITGTMDVDTAIITLGGLDPKAIGASLGALGLAGAVFANMSVKLGITLVYARSKGISAALALGASMVALAISIAIGLIRIW